MNLDLQKSLNATLHTLSLTGLLLVCLYLSWQGLRQVNFGYSLAYDTLNIEKHIEHYAPQNRNRTHFEKTGKQQHLLLFAEIVDSIHDKGKTLEAIRYHYIDNLGQKQTQTLLHDREATHLKDVANLIETFSIAAIVSGWLFILIELLKKKRGITPLRLRSGIMGTLTAASIATLAVLMLGPTEVFYALHDWVFPKEHQWFFYYQDSLMTTLMKAPDLFGFIAVLWLTLALALYLGALYTLRRWL